MLGQDHNMRMRSLDPSPQVYSHSRSRTSSSNVFPQTFTPVQQMQHLQQPQPTMGHTRRSPSVNTFSTTSSNPPPAAYRTSPTADIRRSTSSRSGGGIATSYVALLRKQKATVWCDRAQSEDPRLAAQQRAAKLRANQEVAGGTLLQQSRTSTGIGSTSGKVAAKIRHHGKPGVVGYTPENNYIGVSGVPMRLSATEVEGEDGDEDDLSMRRLHHRRTGSSGRSSTTSSKRALAYRASGASQGSNGKQRWSPGDTPERSGSMVIEDVEYTPGADDRLDRAQSTRSGSSAEKADALPELGHASAAKLASNSLLNAALTREKSVKNPEDLRRRGSVDERTMTLTAGRLFIANPD
ncbi:ribosome biogenesis protein ytm1 [Hypoxylon texense]